MWTTFLLQKSNISGYKADSRDEINVRLVIEADRCVGESKSAECGVRVQVTSVVVGGRRWEKRWAEREY